MSRGDFENVEVCLSPPRDLAISEPPPTTEKYSFIPVNIGTKVEVTMACYEAMTTLPYSTVFCLFIGSSTILLSSIVVEY